MSGIDNASSIIFLKDKAVLKYEGIIQEISYSDLESSYDLSSINKQTVIDYLTGNNMTQTYLIVLVVSIILVFIFYLLTISLDILIISVFGFLASRIFNINIKYKAIYSMAIYSITLSVVLYMIYLATNIITGFQVKYFILAYYGISYIYMITAILMIKSDLIKQQIELMKIVEVQKQVKEDMDRKKEEEKEREEKKKKEDGEQENSDKPDDNKEKKRRGPKPKVSPEGGQAIEKVNE